MDRPDPSRRAILGIPALLALGLQGCATAPVKAANQVAPFSRSSVLDTVPPGWAPYVLRRDMPPTDYRVASLHGQRVLHACGLGVSSGLRCAIQADPRVTPWLRWHWQADEVPPGMCVRDNDTDDSPARVIVAFDGDVATLPLRDRAFFDLVELVTGQRLPYATLMYVWDAQLPVGTVVSYARSSRIRYLVVEGGPTRAGRWLGYERDLRADFRQVFGEEAGPIASVGVLTDSDDLKVEVNTWYGDIGLYPA